MISYEYNEDVVLLFKSCPCKAAAVPSSINKESDDSSMSGLEPSRKASNVELSLS